VSTSRLRFPSTRSRSTLFLLAACAASALLAVSAAAWHGAGHRRATTAAAALLPDEMPRFFIKGIATIRHCSKDPDLFRLRDFPALRDAEAPEHFIDLEFLGGDPLPPLRYDYASLCRQKRLKPNQVGFLPYAVTEWTHRLTIAFAEHRKWPRNPDIQRKTLVYAGLLAHYAQDLCMPLHTTVHYDGRAAAGRPSPRTGLHAKVDALLGKLDAAEIARGCDAPRSYDRVFPAVIEELKRSHSLVSRVYELEDLFPAQKDPIPPDGPVRQFALERARACARFTASLYLTAWRRSAGFQLPEWHLRADTEPK